MAESVKRLAPTAETVRRLYLLSGNQCAFPGCSHPIIVEDGTYVGEVCHICAAEVGGERFDHSQTNEERREFGNLMLMCHDHHVETNDVDRYPVSRMRQIKAAHEARFVVGLASMMEATSVRISDSVINLGGEGGNAPGAGGGGGGAIGPGAIGGSGGSGGEFKQKTISIDEDVVALKIHVGKGGAGGLTGPGEDGEDSFVELVRRDGSVEEVLRAKGGKGGDSDAGDAEISSAVLANSVDWKDGLVYALGGGWTSYYVDTFPANLVFGVLIVARRGKTDLCNITTSLVDPQHSVVATHVQRCTFVSGDVPFAVSFVAGLQDAAVGEWAVVISCGDHELRRLPFNILQRQAQ